MAATDPTTAIGPREGGQPSDTVVAERAERRDATPSSGSPPSWARPAPGSQSVSRRTLAIVLALVALSVGRFAIQLAGNGSSTYDSSADYDLLQAYRPPAYDLPKAGESRALSLPGSRGPSHAADDFDDIVRLPFPFPTSAQPEIRRVRVWSGADATGAAVQQWEAEFDRPGSPAEITRELTLWVTDAEVPYRMAADGDASSTTTTGTTIPPMVVAHELIPKAGDDGWRNGEIRIEPAASNGVATVRLIMTRNAPADDGHAWAPGQATRVHYGVEDKAAFGEAFYSAYDYETARTPDGRVAMGSGRPMVTIAWRTPGSMLEKLRTEPLPFMGYFKASANQPADGATASPSSRSEVLVHDEGAVHEEARFDIFAGMLPAEVAGSAGPSVSAHPAAWAGAEGQITTVLVVR